MTVLSKYIIYIIIVLSLLFNLNYKVLLSSNYFKQYCFLLYPIKMLILLSANFNGFKINVLIFYKYYIGYIKW